MLNFLFLKKIFSFLLSSFRLTSLPPFPLSKKSCPFCDKSILEEQTILVGEEARALYCLTPATLGNILIIPKRHIARFEKLKPKETIEIQNMISKISDAFRELYKIHDYLIIQKNGKEAGQTVSHIHFHIIPCPKKALEIIKMAFQYRKAIGKKEMSERTEELRLFFLENNKK